MTIDTEDASALDDVNPYAPPEADARAPKRGPRAVFAGKPRPWTTSEVLELAWQRVRTQKSVLVRATFCVLGLPQLVAYAPRMFFGFDVHAIPRESALTYSIAHFGAQLVSFFLTCYLTAGANKMWLDVARGKDARFGDLFGGFARTPSTMGSVLLMTIAIGVGLLCLVVPGIVAIGGLGFAQYFVVDAEMGPMRSLSASWEVTKGHRLALVGFWFASIFVMGLGAMACGVGILLAYPIAYVAAAIVYLRISGRWRKKMQPAI